MNTELKVGTEVVTDMEGMDCHGIITAVDEPALGPEFGPTRYTVDWYLDFGFDDKPMFTNVETADQFDIVLREI